jgi:hypothetical protein
MNKNNELNCEECKKRIVFIQIDKNKEFSERFQCLNKDSDKFFNKTVFFKDSALEKDQIQAHTIILNSSHEMKQISVFNDFYCENSRSYQSITEILLVSLIIFIIFTVICLVCCKIPHLSPFVCKHIFIFYLKFPPNTTRESSLCQSLARSGQDSGQILARFWPGLARSGQILARLWPDCGQKIFFLILLIQMFNCDNIHTLRLWKRHNLVSH